MDGKINLKDFSAYRSVLMGVAIIFIMASHSLGRFALYGNIGVEWFLIVSAIGQFYSLSKDDNTERYYRKRLIRLLPAYLAVAIPFFLIKYHFSRKRLYHPDYRAKLVFFLGEDVLVCITHSYLLSYFAFVFQAGKKVQI